MKYQVFIISDAEKDLYEIFKYIATYDSDEKAECMLDELEKTCNSLSQFAERGHIPLELEQIGVFNYREIHYKPYRIIYQIIKDIVSIHCILDDRRDMHQLLEERLIRE